MRTCEYVNCENNIGKRKGKKYCSRDCKNRARQYRKMYENKETECEECGGTDKLIMRRKNHDTNDRSKENVETLCKACYDKKMYQFFRDCGTNYKKSEIAV